MTCDVIINECEETIIIEQIEDVTVLTESDDDVEVIEVSGTQGPTGAQGPAGQAGVSYLTFIADGAIGGQRVVVPTADGKVEYADRTNQDHTNAVIGITMGAADDGDNINVQTGGEITEPGWNWTLHLPVFLSVTGLLTQTYPTDGFVLIIGVPTAPTKLLIGVKLPFVLEN